MRQHPSYFWIKYLLSNETHSFEQVSGIMEMYGLGGVSVSYLEALQEELDEDKPIPFRPRNRAHKASQTWLRKHGIYKAWHRDDSTREALDIASSSKTRALVEMFILSPVSPAQAVDRINTKETDMKLSVGGYERYRHYFWNPKLLSAADWGEFLYVRGESHDNWLKLAVNARGPEGVQLLLWKSGMGALKNLDRAKIFTDFRNIAYMKAKELEAAPASVVDSKTLLNYVRVARAAQDEINNSTDAAKDVLESFNAFRMRRKKLEPPSIQQLTEGNFTPAEDIMAVEDKIDY